MIYMRGQARDYDAWAATTRDDAWSWSHVLPLFRSHEGSFARRRIPRRGRRMAREPATSALGHPRCVRAAAEQAGFPRIDDFNRGDNAGVSYFDVNQRHGLRVSSAKAFLRPAMSRPNLTVWTHA